MVEKKIVLFGGTFDPIHWAHISVADSAAEHIGAEKIIFVVAKRSPLKDLLPRASDIDRLEMITTAIGENKKFEVSDYELKKSAPSYTLDTIKHFQQQFGRKASLYWLVGADSIGELHLWYRIEDLLDRCNLSIMYRGGYQKPDFSKFIDIWGAGRIRKLQENLVQTPMINISSTEIRRRLAAGRDVSDMLCPAVMQYIHDHKLYRTTT